VVIRSIMGVQNPVNPCQDPKDSRDNPEPSPKEKP
jgi:hypothetical protein